MATITRRITIDVTADVMAFGPLASSHDFADDLLGLIQRAEQVTFVESITYSRTYQLHLGMATETEKPGIHTDGDGWNSWGEAPGTESNDATTLHYLWPEPVTIAAASEIVAAMRPHLLPMTTERDAGVIAVVSDWDTWSEDQVATWHA